MTDNSAQSEMFISRRDVLKLEARNRLLIQKIKEYMVENKQLKQRLTESEATIQRMTEESSKYTPISPHAPSVHLPEGSVREQTLTHVDAKDGDVSRLPLPDIDFLNTETESFFTNNF